jgi:hypothetical protein
MTQQKGKPTWSLLALLLAYGALATLPIIFVGGYLLFRVVEAELTQLQERAHQVAVAVASDVERELQRRVAVLATLATSPRLDEQDFAGFQLQASAAVANDGTGVLLHDANTKQQLVNTFVQYGTPLPTTGDPETFDRVLLTRQPEISDLFISLVTKTPTIDIAFPVFKNGNVRYVLKLALTPGLFWEIIAEQSLDLQWKVTIVDRRGVIIARSPDHDWSLGQSLPADELKEIQRGRNFGSKTLNAEIVYAAWANVRPASWLVLVSAPFSVAQAPLNRSIAWLALAAGLAVIATLLLGVWFASRISRPLSGIAAVAETLGGKGSFLIPPGSYKEADVLAAALKRAGRTRQAEGYGMDSGA